MRSFKTGRERCFSEGSGDSTASARSRHGQPHVPPIVITSFRKLNREVALDRPVPETARLVLSRKDYLFSFGFSALDFAIPSKNRYAYKMEGLDPDWIPATASQRVATYTNLSPGRYTFRVKGTNNDGLWNEKGAAVGVTITPAFWQTWWFKLVVILCLLGLLFSLNRRHLENVRLKTELKTAREAQMSIMPQRDPELDGFQVSAVCIPASEIGGDFFDYIWLDGEKVRFGIVVADVAGKGMKAAMTALLTSGMIHSKIDEVGSIQEIVTRLNRSLCPKIGRNMFTALCLASINVRTRELAFVNAGLTEPVMKRGRRVETVRSEGPRFALGVNWKSIYEEKTVRLETGDVVLFFTDGLTDMRNEKGEFFGMEGLAGVLEEMDTRQLSASQIKDRIIRAVMLFSTEPHPPDDITLVVAKVAQ